MILIFILLINPSTRLSNKHSSKDVVIHDNVFIGANVVILKGTTIGKNSVISAGSVVSGEVKEDVSTQHIII
ncbi:hypothetical protein HWQ46_19500 [Shewanella sp. D64]|uniref:DapH/DapD/GlmU-related protein n=1 Tax=unclassified Shewanella TaxID=196818 RepID=UPI002DD77967|nr:hypothetical protein [Shewanella sp. D64]MEC4737498.1 hypothetical protein [Shewanella sp. E94]WBJ98142.1 hypothetical protein HWQ47_09525 [Shewanella sp. MTB7]